MVRFAEYLPVPVASEQAVAVRAVVFEQALAAEQVVAFEQARPGERAAAFAPDSDVAQAPLFAEVFVFVAQGPGLAVRPVHYLFVAAEQAQLVAMVQPELSFAAHWLVCYYG